MSSFFGFSTFYLLIPGCFLVKTQDTCYNSPTKKLSYCWCNNGDLCNNSQQFYLANYLAWVLISAHLALLWYLWTNILSLSSCQLSHEETWEDKASVIHAMQLFPYPKCNPRKLKLPAANFLLNSASSVAQLSYCDVITQYKTIITIKHLYSAFLHFTIK